MVSRHLWHIATVGGRRVLWWREEEVSPASSVGMNTCHLPATTCREGDYQQVEEEAASV